VIWQALFSRVSPSQFQGLCSFAVIVEIPTPVTLISNAPIRFMLSSLRLVRDP